MSLCCDKWYQSQPNNLCGIGTLQHSVSCDRDQGFEWRRCDTLDCVDCEGIAWACSKTSVLDIYLVELGYISDYITYKEVLIMITHFGVLHTNVVSASLGCDKLY